MTLAGRPSEWRQPWRDHYEERLAIMNAEDVLDAASKAEYDVRRMAAREQGGLFE